jgi:hypothetical protein
VTQVISIAGRRVGTLTLPAPRKRPAETQPGLAVERQAAIENSLSMALYFVRQPGHSAANLWAATARANRALTLLKQSVPAPERADPEE